MTTVTTIPETGYLRVWQIIGDRRRGLPAIYPVSRSTWYQGVRDGIYPQPIRLSERTSAWRVEDVRALIDGTWPGLAANQREYHR
jgi:prophage regulatory protein